MAKRRFDVPIRGLTNELRRQGFEFDGDSSGGGVRAIFYKKRVSPSRVLDVKLFGDGGHGVSHFLHHCQTTRSTGFSTVEELRAAIKHETERTDNRYFVSWAVEHYEGGCPWSEQVLAHLLAQEKLTADESPESVLVRRFAEALLAKLRAAEEKHGYNGAWRRRDWLAQLPAELLRHVDKGNPVDVAAYCAFAWHHGLTLAIEPAP